MGCGRDIPIDLPEHQPKLVMSSLFCSDSTFTVYLSQSKATNTKEKLSLIKNGTVDLYENDVFIEKLQLNYQLINNDSIFYYRSHYKAKTGMMYRIAAQAPGLPAVEATDMIPQPGEIKNLKIESIENSQNGFDTLVTARISFDIEDVPGVDNYYHITLEHELLPDFFNSFYTIEDLSAEGAINGTYMYKDDQFKNGTKKVVMKVEINQKIKMLKIQLRTISDDYFLFQKSYALQNSNIEVPFSEPVAVHNNVKNGYGILAGYSVSVDSLSF